MNKPDTTIPVNDTPLEAKENTFPKSEELSEEERAFLTHRHQLNKFLKALESYEGSKRQIQKAWGLSAIAPFNKDEPKFSYPGERELYESFGELNSAKFLLMLYGLVREKKIQILSPILDGITSTDEEVINDLKPVKEGESNG